MSFENNNKEKDNLLSSFFIAVATTNETKVQAVQEVIKEYPSLVNGRVVAIAVPSGVSDQPLSLKETILGAKNRAENAFKKCENCQLSFGIESGLVEAEGTKTGFLNTCVCSIYDGNNHYVGSSMGFEVPPKVLEFVIEKKMDLNEACYRAGIASHMRTREEGGLIAILTHGKVTRQKYVREAVMAALVPWENNHLFS